MVAYNGNYPGFPGYYVVEGNVLFGAKVVRPEAIIKLVASASIIKERRYNGTIYRTRIFRKVF